MSKYWSAPGFGLCASSSFVLSSGHQYMMLLKFVSPAWSFSWTLGFPVHRTSSIFIWRSNRQATFLTYPNSSSSFAPSNPLLSSVPHLCKWCIHLTTCSCQSPWYLPGTLCFSHTAHPVCQKILLTPPSKYYISRIWPLPSTSATSSAVQATIIYIYVAYCILLLAGFSICPLVFCSDKYFMRNKHSDPFKISEVCSKHFRGFPSCSE